MKKIFLLLSFPLFIQCKPAGPQDSLIQSVSITLEKIRGTSFHHSVKVGETDSKKIKAYLEERIAEEYTPEELEREKSVMVILGLIPQTFPYKEKVLGLLSQEIAGFYDPTKKALFLASKIKDSEKEDILVHELTHALQDQYFQLEELIHRNKENDDETLALHAIIEGEAMAVMVDYSLQKQGVSIERAPAFRKLYEQEMEHGHENDANYKGVPNFMVKSLLFPYVEGLKFIDQIKEEKGWPAVSGLFKKPPESTEQIIHPEKYGTDHPQIISKGQIKFETEKVLTSNVMGEMGIQVIFETMNPKVNSKEVAAGWGGDRYWLIEKPDHTKAFVWLLDWDTEKDAEQFTKAWKETYASIGGMVSAHKNKTVTGLNLTIEEFRSVEKDGVLKIGGPVTMTL